MSDPGTTNRAIERLRSAAAALRGFEPALLAGRPWPLHVVEHDAGPDSEWGPTEVLAHVAELLPYWLGEIARILDGGPKPAPFGRTVDDRLRVLTIERDRSLPPAELLDRIESSVDRYAHRLDALPPAAMQRKGLHPTRGEMPVEAVLERFVLAHSEEHVEQLARALGSNATTTG